MRDDDGFVDFPGLSSDYVITALDIKLPIAFT